MPGSRHVLGSRWEYDPGDPFRGGKNAQAYPGVDLETGDEVVVKIFKEGAGGRGRERFLREGRLHEALKHEAILELLGRKSEGEDCPDYIVTRRLRPGDLWGVVRENVVSKKAALRPFAVKEIGIRIAAALAYMHERGEIHGDMSPGNVLLDGTGAAYLADFGLSKRVEPLVAASSGDSWGTPGFSPPLEGRSHRTYEDDVYGLAAVLWFCLAGAEPAASARQRRRQIPDRTLRAPLAKALAWGDSPIPDAEKFGRSIAQGWHSVGRDWRVVSSAPRRSPLPALALAGLVGLLVATGTGRIFEPRPADAADSVIDGHGLSLNLNGDWRQREPPPLPGLGLDGPVAAGRGRTTIVAGRAAPAGQKMIRATALRTLPKQARAPRSVTVGSRSALRYGPATRFGGSIELLAMPLGAKVLVIRCSGPTSGLAAACAQASADLNLASGSVQPLAPSGAVARKLRAAVDRLNTRRRLQRSRLAAAAGRAALAATAEKLARVNRAFAEEVGRVPTTGQDVAIIDSAVRAGGKTGAAYAELAAAGTDAEWQEARSRVVSREGQLGAAVRRLGSLDVYGG